MTREEIIEFCEMNSQLEPENEDVFNYIIEVLRQEPCEDAISREAALMCMTGKYIADLEYKPEDIISQHIKRLKMLHSVTPTQKWIPISKRLPKTDGVYTVTRKLYDNQIDIEPYYIVDACYFDGTDTWHDDNRINHNRHPVDDIIAWMPLPEIYSEVEE